MNYDKYPVTKVQTDTVQAWRGYDSILNRLREAVQEKSRNGKCVLAVETYPGVDEQELVPALEALGPQLVLDTRRTLCCKEEFRRRIYPFLTDDRVFGRMFYGTFEDFQQPQQVEALRKEAEEASGLIIIWGMGAAQLVEPDILVYADMARWEIQQRFRKGMPNYYTDNGNEDNLKKIKQGYFFEWRMADKLKRKLYDKLDFYLDTNRPQDPSMLTGEVFRAALRQVVTGPFRTVPYFDPGVWGGQWMKTVCGLDPQQKNYAWSFDGVPEENSIYLEVNGVLVESPAINLVFYCPKELLGPQVYARFGAEFPIRFDFLDTMDGQNLSLQVHPLTDYIHNQLHPRRKLLHPGCQRGCLRIFGGKGGNSSPGDAWRPAPGPGRRGCFPSRTVCEPFPGEKTRPFPHPRGHHPLFRKKLHGAGDQRHALPVHHEAVGLGPSGIGRQTPAHPYRPRGEGHPMGPPHPVGEG